MKTLTVAVIQLSVQVWNREENVNKAAGMVSEAARNGAEVIVLPELFEYPYFCTEHDAKRFQLAQTLEESDTLRQMTALAKEFDVIIPVSVYERCGNTFFNSVFVIDGSRGILGCYRKTHIPHSPGYFEKYYFSPGDTGFKVWDTSRGKLGVGICWDQWFPECARAMALAGADLLVYPTAIGSEPGLPELDTSGQWQRVMQGHAAANMIPVAAANRTGTEQGRDFPQTYYGSSFITDHTGEIMASLDKTTEGIKTFSFDPSENSQARKYWGVFRDRRPECYQPLLTHDGKQH